MNRIFKYELNSNRTSSIHLPKGYRVIRVDKVEGVYYLWAIVNPDVVTIDCTLTVCELPVLEKFNIKLPEDSEIIHVTDDNGKFYLWALTNKTRGIEKDYYIECYKTGMEIHTPIDELKYLGLCKLFVMQELGLYLFLNETTARKNSIKP